MERTLKKRRPMLFKKRYAVKFYPILPFEKRVKRVREEKPTVTTSPVKVHKIIWSQRRVDLTGATNMYSNVNQMLNIGFSSTRTFQRNTNWKTLVATGQNATYPYSRTGGLVKPIQYRGTSTGGGTTSTSYGTAYGSVLVQPQLYDTLTDIATARLKNKLNGYIGNAQLQAPLAEAREIHRIVRQINGLGISTVKALLAAKKTRGKSLAKQFGDIWLGFGFGVNPMLKDIEKAANSVLDYTTRQDRRVRVAGSASVDFNSRAVSNYGNIAEGVLIDVYSSATHRQGVKIVAGIDLLMRSAASYSVADHLGLKIEMVPSTLWELTPFSWVVDYAFTVGPWLDDMFYTLPGVVKYVSKTTKYQNEVVWAPKLVHGTYKVAIATKNGRSRYFSFARTSLTALPYRQLRLKSVDEVANHGLTKFLNLASVISGRRGGPQLDVPVRAPRRIPRRFSSV